MHRTLRPFELLEPESVQEAVQILASAPPGAKILAGGLDLVSRMTRWQIDPPCLISLQRIPAMDFLEVGENGYLRIGPMTTLRSLELSALVRERWPLLQEAAHQIASVQVKTMGTLVGNLCVATPASDMAPVLFVLAAQLGLVGPAGSATIPIEDFFVPVCQSILEPQQIVVEVSVPPMPARAGTAFKKLAHTKACIAKVNAAVLVTVEGGLCRDARIALGAVAPTVVRAHKAEQALQGKPITRQLACEAANLAAAEVTPISDLRASADYRTHVAAVLIQRAIFAAAECALAPDAAAAGHALAADPPTPAGVAGRTCGAGSQAGPA